MPPITHLFFDLHGTLIDSENRLPLCYDRALGEYMAAHYGGQPHDWVVANRRIMADWDSYYADLDFSAEDGLDQMWEGETRIMRARFRLAGVPYPSAEALSVLVRRYAFHVTSRCDAFFPDAHDVLPALHSSRLTLGVITHALDGHARGLLAGGGVERLFRGPIITSEAAGRFGKDVQCFRFACLRAGVPAAQCVVVDDSLQPLRVAAGLGAHVVLIDRKGAHKYETRFPVVADLRPLAGMVRDWTTQGED